MSSPQRPSRARQAHRWASCCAGRPPPGTRRPPATAPARRPSLSPLTRRHHISHAVRAATARSALPRPDIACHCRTPQGPPPPDLPCLCRIQYLHAPDCRLHPASTHRGPRPRRVLPLWRGRGRGRWRSGGRALSRSATEGRGHGGEGPRSRGTAERRGTVGTEAKC